MTGRVIGIQAHAELREVEPSPRVLAEQAKQKPPVDYSTFSHRTHVAKEKLGCDSCHKLPTQNWKEARGVDAAFPDVADFPAHAACLNCHREQFLAKDGPALAICSNCHTPSGLRDGTRFLFPSLGDVSDSTKARRHFVPAFSLFFPHAKHVELVGENRLNNTADRRGRFISASIAQGTPQENQEPKSCPVCHQTLQPQGAGLDKFVSPPPKDIGDRFWLMKGTFKTILNNHATCFSCHSQDAEITPVSAECDACHKLPSSVATVATDFDPTRNVAMGVKESPMLERWQRRMAAGTFRHEGVAHAKLTCIGCHDVFSMNTTQLPTLKVPVKACGGSGGCHLSAIPGDRRTLNYEIEQRKKNAAFQCTECHLVLGRSPVPASHAEAITLKR